MNPTTNSAPAVSAAAARRFALAGILICLWLGAIQYFAQGASAYPVPFSTSRTEAFVLDGVMRVRHGDTLYRSIEEAPTSLHVYNPFTYTVAAWAAWPFEAHAETLLRSGRLISLLATLGLSALLGFWAWRTYRSLAAALFAAAAPIYFHDIALTQFFRLRPETPATLASAAAIVVMSLCNRNIRHIFLAAALCILAFLFKQSFIAAPLAIAVFLATKHQWRELMGFCGVYGGGIGVFLLLMFLVTGSAYFDNTITAMAINDLHLAEALSTYSKYFFGNSWGLLLSALAAAAYCITVSKNNLILIFWVVAAVWNIYSSSKTGSSANYFAEFAIASVLLITHVLFETEGARDTKRTPALRALVWLPLSIQILAGAGQGFAPRPPVLIRDDANVDLTRYLGRYGSNEGKLIFHEKVAIQLGQPAGYDWYLLDTLAARGRFDPQVLMRKISCGKYATVVFSTKPYSRIEHEIYRQVTAGAYRLKYQDATIIEFQRWPANDPGSSSPTALNC